MGVKDKAQEKAEELEQADAGASAADEATPSHADAVEAARLEAEEIIAKAQAVAQEITQSAEERAVELEAQRERDEVVAAAARGDLEGSALVEALQSIAATQAAIVERLEQAPAPAAVAETGENWLALTAEQALAQLEGTASDEPPLTDGLERLIHPVTFRSRGPNYSAVHKGRHRTTAPNGEVQVSTGYRYDFAPNGEFTTDNPIAVAWLRARPFFNTEYWEVGNEPGRVPSPEKVIERIVQAIRDLDDDALAAIEAEEREGHGREIVLQTAAAGRRTVLAEG